MMQRKSVVVPAVAAAASPQSQASVASTVSSTARKTAAAAAPTAATATVAAVAAQEPQDDAPLGSRTGGDETIRPGTVGASIRLNVLQLLSPSARSTAAPTVQVRTPSLLTVDAVHCILLVTTHMMQT
jgi:hypothetical protein